MIAITPSLNASSCRPSILNSLHPPDFTFHNHAVSLQRFRCRASQHGAGAHVELRTMPGTHDCRSVEFAFVQRALLMGTCRLRGTEIARKVKHRDVADQYGRTTGSGTAIYVRRSDLAASLSPRLIA
jgi:hypothetical protein